MLRISLLIIHSLLLILVAGYAQNLGISNISTIKPEHR